jgi:hypothetical protein
VAEFIAASSGLVKRVTRLDVIAGVVIDGSADANAHFASMRQYLESLCECDSAVCSCSGASCILKALQRKNLPNPGTFLTCEEPTDHPKLRHFEFECPLYFLFCDRPLLPASEERRVPTSEERQFPTGVKKGGFRQVKEGGFLFGLN